ncbi:MAG TPA: RcnB family protein [Acidisoma sp.]|uniref:RcnB family protein n=1 Tax=Acidisoma sp. TaxID=1872115 RepID=UPI002BA43B29|nr:RcnB family protein [Acidisoma sp.]HTI01656.1 RcnB family protein [Acidisoma sp.]
MKRLLPVTLALTLAAAPLAMAQPMNGPGGGPPPPPHGGPGGYDHGPGAPGHDHGYDHGYNHGHDHGYNHGHDHGYDHGYDHGHWGPGGPPPPGGWHHWRQGERFDAPHGYWRPVPNWHAYRGLYPPPPGQQWIWYNNQYMLVAITSGIIGAVLGATMAPQPYP